MKNKTSILAITLLMPLCAYSQVGILTPNPQGSLHVDGAKDNPAIGAPSIAQQANDVIVTPNGSFGVGTTAPENKFHVVTSTGISNRFSLIDAPAGAGFPILALRNTSPTIAGGFSLLGFTNNGAAAGGATWGIGSIRNAANTLEDFYFGSSQGAGYNERLRITNAGLVGIGTSTPTNTLHVNGTVRIANGSEGANRVLTSDANGVATWKDVSAVSSNINIYNNDGTLTGNRTVTQNANTLAFTGTAVNAFSVDGSTFSVDAANDRVGLGTSTPENKFHVVTGAAVNNRHSLIDAAAGNTGLPILALRNTSAAAAGNFSLLGFTNQGPGSGGASWGIGSVRNSDNSNEDFYFGNSPVNGGYVERMRIKSNGYVGINTNSPENRFHVVTSEAVSNRYTLIDAPAGAGLPILSLRNTSAATANSFALLGFTNNGATAGGATWGIGSVRNATNTLEDFYFGSSQGGGYNERVRITNGGLVGIGTSTPHSPLDLGTGLGRKLAIYDNANGGDFYGLGVSAGTLQFHAAASPSAEPGMVLANSGGVGIGTNSPQSTLDVVGKPASPSNLDGIIPPRLTGDQLSAKVYGGAQAGAIVYVTVGDNSPSGQTAKVNRAGHYYFDGSIWQKMSNTANTSAAFTMNTTKTISYNVPSGAVPFGTVLFNNTPPGIISQLDAGTIQLAKGITYKIDVNMGRMSSSDNNHTWCTLYNSNTGASLSSAAIFPMANTGNSWNTSNTLQAYITPTTATNIQIGCDKTNAGTVTLNTGIAPVWTVTVMTD